MSIPTQGEQFAILLDHLRRAQEASAMLAHLVRDNDALQAQGWLAISELMRKVQHEVTNLARRRMQ